MKKLVGLLFVSFSVFASHAGLTWNWGSLPSDTTASNAIAAAMNQAVATYNTYSDYNYTISVAYNSGVPTAQASYHGWIEFGGSISYRVAMHEMSHWLGTGTTGSWSAYASGSWTGAYVNNNIQAYDGPTATEACDSMHYWPYGWNYDNEAVNPERLVGLVGAFLRDQGLDEDRTIGFAPGTYRLRNRVTIKMLDTEGSTSNGAQVKEYSASGSVNQQWVLSLVPGTTYFKLQSVASGKYLDSLGNTTNGSAIGLAAASASTNQQWRVMKTEAGFYQIINVASGKALDTGGQNAEGAGMQGWASGGSWNQQWKFVHVTPAAKPVGLAGLISQFRPVTASSTSGAHLPENAVDGNPTVTRWTADGGSYPQWWRVDLGSIYNITNVITYWYPGWTFKYRIETSTNDVNYTVAVNATGNTVVGYTTNTFSATARYVRITSTGISPSGGWASFYDCQIFGSLQTPPAATGGLLHRYDFTSNANDSVGTAHGTLRGSATISGGALNTTNAAGGLSGGVPQNGVQLPPAAVSNITGPFTIESWFVANDGAGFATLFSFSGNNTGSYVMATPDRGNVSAIFVVGGGGCTVEQQANTQNQDNGAPHQMVVTYNGTTLSYYIDGVLGSSTGLSPTITDPGLVLATLTYIGINGGSPWADKSFNGSTRDFRIYGQSLTAGQVASLYTLGSDASNSAISASLVPPAAPTGLAATPSNSQVRLGWTASSGATSYNVKWSTTNGGPYSIITNVTTSSATNTSLVNGTRYYYVVSAVNVSGESTNSAQVGATPSSTEPVNVSISVLGGSLNLFWPTNHTGWRLQAQTNSPVTGLGTNWFDVAGSGQTNSMTLPVDANNGSVFYRLVYP